MSDYTLTTDEVRDNYVGKGFVGGAVKEYTEFARSRIGAEFDRWLNSVKAEAWDEGESAGEYSAGNGIASLLSGVEPPPPTENPYRTGGAE